MKKNIYSHFQLNVELYINNILILNNNTIYPRAFDK